MAATTSSGCPSFFNPKSSSSLSPAGQRTRKAPAGSGRMDGAAMWVINGLAAAFFTSMERCSCIRIATVGDADEGTLCR
ncbi:hypothetical protein MLD38_034855 [Melastoma candidum]|uniref:Uncharacterized protein n=1 Tax=Melastoma candidum TaxID=119954 RepID=A0ACB9MBX8_9MYRT|nr:hypothetical protein MLD38_034855 [Melastoma candidum]